MIGLDAISKERIRIWKQEKKEEKKQRIEQIKQREIQQKQEKKQREIQQKEEIKQRIEENKKIINNFINEYYEITSNPNDKVQSSIIAIEINKRTKSFVNSKIIKNILLNMEGISSKKISLTYFCGLRPRDNINEKNDQ